MAVPASLKQSSERVLVIDDDDVALSRITESLTAAGYDVVARKTAPGLVDMRRLGPSAVICDLLMDGMDGEQVVLGFRNEPELRDLPFILISADALRLEGALERLPWLHCVSKDVSLAPLLNTLEKLMERSRVLQSGRFRLSEPQQASAPLRPSSSELRERGRYTFFADLGDTTRALRPYLIGGVLGPRAHAEVHKRLHKLRREAGLAMTGTCMVEVLVLCEALADFARRDLHAMELLAACNGWLMTLSDASEAPLVLESVPLLCEVKRLVG